MPKASVVKTAWAHKPTRLLAIVLVAMAVAAVAMAIYASVSGPKLRIGARTYKLDVAATPAQQELGLGGRTSLPAGRGMLFPYSTPGNYCFWMKGMQFPLDIIWLNSDKDITMIEHNLSPQTYPKSYCPPKPDTRYVIELNAGQAVTSGMRTGDQLHF